jgi:hypothetical protein
MKNPVISHKRLRPYSQKCDTTPKNKGFIACQFAAMLKRVNTLFLNMLMTINRYRSNHHRERVSPLYFKAKNKEGIPPCYVAMIPPRRAVRKVKKTASHRGPRRCWILSPKMEELFTGDLR